jgi:hypothetical protein
MASLATAWPVGDRVQTYRGINRDAYITTATTNQ